jgi:DNA-binding Lrp family transcriptional regulator
VLPVAAALELETSANARETDRPTLLPMDPLLHLLQHDARATHADLAAQLNVSESEAAARISALEQEGVILGYHTLIDREKTGGNSVTALIEVKITPEREGGFDRLAGRIAAFDQVRSCHLMSGGYDLLVLVEGRNLREVASFVSEKLSPLAGVISTATHFQLKAYKQDGVLFARTEAPRRLAVSP